MELAPQGPGALQAPESPRLVSEQPQSGKDDQQQMMNTKNNNKNAQKRTKQKVMEMSELCKVKAAAEPLPPTQPKRDDDLSILPPSMRKNFLATMNRNREAFAMLAKS